MTEEELRALPDNLPFMPKFVAEEFLVGMKEYDLEGWFNEEDGEFVINSSDEQITMKNVDGTG